MTDKNPPSSGTPAVPPADLPGRPAGPAPSAGPTEADARLLIYAQPVMEHLYRQLARRSTLVLLADAAGVVLSSVGHAAFLDDVRYAGPAAAPGERHADADAIAIALNEQRPVVACDARPGLPREGSLVCLATPIRAPGGGVLGILDRAADGQHDHSHGLALLEIAAEMIENRLIPGAVDSAMTVRFHPVAQILGTPLEGLVAFDEDGTLLAGNRRARSLLELADAAPPITHTRCFMGGWEMLVDLALQAAERPCSLRASSGRPLAAILSPTRRAAGER
ncbi:MAG: sigma-54-dependent Fis family transcriptional regulator, partial [Zoogloea sp.]|nr:sigma-54-dependent Fis family transcriptional regulator [Zoogloea sp.]